MKNGEGYHDPTAGQAIRNAFKSAKQKQIKQSSMRNAARRECLTYNSSCFKLEDGQKKICPLKEDKRKCLVITGTDEEIETAYRLLFPVGK